VRIGELEKGVSRDRYLAGQERLSFENCNVDGNMISLLVLGSCSQPDIFSRHARYLRSIPPGPLYLDKVSQRASKTSLPSSGTADANVAIENLKGPVITRANLELSNQFSR